MSKDFRLDATLDVRIVGTVEQPPFPRQWAILDGFPTLSRSFDNGGVVNIRRRADRITVEWSEKLFLVSETPEDGTVVLEFRPS